MGQVKLHYLTKSGHRKLVKEAKRINKELKGIAGKLKSIRQEINLRESGDWEVVSSQYRQLEDRLQQINSILSNAVILKKNGKLKAVQLGSKVYLKNGDKELCYTLVDTWEANPFEGKISRESQIGRALLGKRVRDTIRVILPKGSSLYKILKIR